ncbi:MAG: copper amine oxidase N-terminal domain-containing protein [Armatimonadetes bacterium]|nr:copper amine oxidase N-terminal domain-containing protein [Armatimonadota bacterium]
MSLAVYPLSGGARARRRPAWTGWFLGACLLLAVPGLAATDYTLEVDGQPVAFTGAGPVVVSGQVLVPLRGILERIGATVQWSPQTKLVRAQRGTTTLELTVGQRSAVVNGRRVSLQVPAMFMRGTVMVPLRFVAEALGVSVHATRGRIQIATQPGAKPAATTKPAAPPRATAAKPTTPAPTPAVRVTPPAGTRAADDGDHLTTQSVAGTVESVNAEGTPPTITISTDGKSAEYQLAPGAVILGRPGKTAHESTLAEVCPGDRAKAKRDAVTGRITILVVEYEQVTGEVAATEGDRVELKDAGSVTVAEGTPVLLADGTKGTRADLRVGDTVRVRLRPETRSASQVAVTRATTTVAQAPAEPATPPAPEPTPEPPAPEPTPAPAPTPPPAPELKVTSFSHDAKGPLRQGSVLTVTLEGEAGATATFDVGTVAQGLAMQETAPGKYSGTYTIPEGLNARVAIFGKVARDGKESPLVQAGIPVVIDSIAPQVSDLAPDKESLIPDPQPTIYAVFEDAEGSGVDADSVKLSVAGEDVTTEATRTSRFITYRPVLPLANGPVPVRVTVTDLAGNETTAEWQFTVNAPEVPIRSVTHNATRPVDANQSFSVTVAGKPRATVTFSIGSLKSGLPMTETAPGIYQGRYTAVKGDVAVNARIVAQLVTETGEQFTRECSEPITILTVPPRTPQITAPAEGEVLEGAVVVSGKAQPGVTVRVQVVRKVRKLGLWSDKDVVAAQEVSVDSQGTFMTGKLQVPRSGKPEAVTIQVVAVDVAGHRSEIASVKIKVQ